MQHIKDYLFAQTRNYAGWVTPEFEDLAKQFSRLQDARTQQGGAALAVYFQGQKVVDIWTGKKSATEDWQSDTLSVCYSTGKGVLATLAHILVSQGLLDYDTPICLYWPEFAQNGKASMTLRHVLSHQSGLYDIRNIIADATEMADWSHMLNVLAQAKPRFAVATEAAYQPLTFGWLVGGILEKATGQSLAELMQQYLVEPLALDGAYFGVPASELSRVARPFKTTPVTQPKSVTPPANKVSTSPSPKSKSVQRPVSILDKAIAWSGQDPQDFQDGMIPKGMKNFSFFSDAGLQAVIPAANGVFSAQSLARIYAMLAQGGSLDGRQFIQPAIFQQLSQVQYRQRDRVMPIPMLWRLGYHRILSLGKASNGFGHMGFNGSGAWCDPERQLSFAYTHNFAAGSLIGDYRLWGLSQEAIRCADRQLQGRKGWF
nr:serine hydrolase domain-containing protein [Acinetobacter towneri]